MCIGFVTPETIAIHGNADDWKHSCSTEPFILKDYITPSSITHARNLDYWETNPIGLGKRNQVPYIDTYKKLIIGDVSTQLAAFLTGKVDIIWDAITLEKRNSPSILKMPL